METFWPILLIISIIYLLSLLLRGKNAWKIRIVILSACIVFFLYEIITASDKVYFEALLCFLGALAIIREIKTNKA